MKNELKMQIAEENSKKSNRTEEGKNLPPIQKRQRRKTSTNVHLQNVNCDYFVIPLIRCVIMRVAVASVGVKGWVVVRIFTVPIGIQII